MSTRDNRIGVHDARSHHRRQPDGAGSEDGDTQAGLDCERVHDRSGASLYPAAERREEIQRQRLGDVDQIARGGGRGCGSERDSLRPTKDEVRIQVDA
jgi:hypothetical protein